MYILVARNPSSLGGKQMLIRYRYNSTTVYYYNDYLLDKTAESLSLINLALPVFLPKTVCLYSAKLLIFAPKSPLFRAGLVDILVIV